MKSANFIYFGSPEFSAQILTSLLPTGSNPVGTSLLGGWPNGLPRGVMPVNVVGIVTSPDKPLGRKQVLTPSPVAQLAAKHDLPLFKPEKLDQARLAHLRLLKPDIFLVVSYGKFIPDSWLTVPTRGTLNVHFSLLPKYRGALCISEAIKNQDHETGVTLMVMDAQMDHGPVITQEKVTIDINDNLATLTEKLTHTAINLLNHELPLYLDGVIGASPQDEGHATYTPVIKTRTRDSALISWKTIQCAMSNEQCALTTHALIRSLNPDPGAWTKIKTQMANGKWQIVETKIIKTELTRNSIGHMLLAISQIQLAGKSPISWKQFIGGHPGIH